MKVPIFGTKNALSGYSWPRIKKKLLSELKSAHSNWSISKTSQQKCLNFGPKMLYLGIFDKKCPIWVFWARILKNLLSNLKSAPSNLSISKISRKSKNA